MKKKFHEVMEANEGKDNFKDVIKNYIEKRTYLIQRALRLAKKIVNDENEYEKFYENYFGKNFEK